MRKEEYFPLVQRDPRSFFDEEGLKYFSRIIGRV